MRIVALGTTEFLVESIRGLTQSGDHQILQVISLTDRLKPDNSFDLNCYCKIQGIPYFEVDNINETEVINYLISLKPELIYSAWPKILKREILSIPKFGVVGTHPTELPFNKGRHPLHWQIVLSLSHSKLSFFWMNEGVDSGPVIIQVPYPIQSHDTIATLVKVVNEAAYLGCQTLSQILLQTPLVAGTKQNQSDTNVWRKRDRHDVLIDFRMSSESILALIRSFTVPYPCASFIFEKRYIQVVSGHKIEVASSVPVEYFEPGYVFYIRADTLCIKVADGTLLLQLKQNMEQLLEKPCKYIFPPSKYIANHPELAHLFS